LSDRTKSGHHKNTHSTAQEQEAAVNSNQSLQQSKKRHSYITMAPKQTEKKTLVKSTKLTQGEKKKVKNENKAKANPGKAEAKKEKNDAKRERRYVISSNSAAVAAAADMILLKQGRVVLLFI
jgi:hypothetical protein